ncbi:hypothetical protein NQZ68_004970 [Dissostichus eleginoides]|nr:hypothetical protein NQZ68_004970 [Dissostichus eleginoides]
MNIQEIQPCDAVPVKVKQGVTLQGGGLYPPSPWWHRVRLSFSPTAVQQPDTGVRTAASTPSHSHQESRQPVTDRNFPPLWFALTPAVQQIPTEQPAVFTDPNSPSSCFRRSLLPNFLEQHICAAAASDPVSAAPVGCRWKPVYHVKVGDDNPAAWWKCRSYGGSDSPATSRPVDCVAAEMTVTK